VSLINLVSTIRSLEDPPFPLHQRELCAYVLLTSCRGPIEGRIEIVHADSGNLVIQGQSRQLPLPNEPLELAGLSFRLRNLPFPEPGLYEARFVCDGVVIAEQPLLLR
jgi:hypothetical protein